MSYGDYVEQLTYLLFLKMADERSRPPYSQPSLVPARYAWSELLARDGDALFDHYRHTLEALGNEKGSLALIFNKAQNKFQDPAKLRRVIVDLIDAENWSSMSADVKGDAYEGLLEKNAQDTKSGVRPVLHASSPDRRDGGLHRTPAGRACVRPRMRHRRLSLHRAQLHRPPSPEPHQGRETAPEGRRVPRLGAGAGHRPCVRDEPCCCTASARTSRCPWL